MTRTLLLIFAALAFMIGSFIWFVATWDASKEEPISLAPASSWPILGLRPSNAETIPRIVSSSHSTLPPEGPPAAGAHFIEKGTT